MPRMLNKDPSLRYNASEIETFLDKYFNIENQLMKMEINYQTNDNKKYECN
jgi:hypothetical protein